MPRTGLGTANDKMKVAELKAACTVAPAQQLIDHLKTAATPAPVVCTISPLTQVVVQLDQATGDQATRDPDRAAAIRLTKADVKRLQEREILSTSLVDFGISRLQERLCAEVS